MVMRALTGRPLHIFLTLTFVASLVCLAPSVASAQSEGSRNIVLDVAKGVLFDPTTYAPAALSYTSQRMDWNSSQALFKAGWLEHNARYTMSGRADDTPLGYEAGNRQIRRDALVHLQIAVVNNLSAQILERSL